VATNDRGASEILSADRPDEWEAAGVGPAGGPGDGVDHPRRQGGRRPKAHLGEIALLVVTVVGLAAGTAFWLADLPGASDLAWAVTTLIGLVPAAGGVAVSLWHRRLGVDVIAVLALVGALGVGEYLAGALIAVMVATGRMLEGWAAGRAERALRELVAGMPRTALRRTGGTLSVIDADQVAVGDLLLIRPGELVPTDGRVEAGTAILDESTLSGEPVPVERTTGDAVSSGVVNAGGPFDLRATRTARESTYAGIVRMVEAAKADTAPFVRLAGRYALVFLPVALAVAALGWLWSGQLARAVAVLVVASPAPATSGRSWSVWTARRPPRLLCAGRSRRRPNAPLPCTWCTPTASTSLLPVRLWSTITHRFGGTPSGCSPMSWPRTSATPPTSRSTGSPSTSSPATGCLTLPGTPSCWSSALEAVVASPNSSWAPRRTSA